eukprot:GHUV01043692.1.p1 GENE.GHUV01043692.1~~GHUV01043692.1.p1  ORF type:complete len:176 (-),score=60.07 GHUV01043692.1:212-739(-)
MEFTTTCVATSTESSSAAGFPAATRRSVSTASHPHVISDNTATAAATSTESSSCNAGWGSDNPAQNIKLLRVDPWVGPLLLLVVMRAAAVAALPPDCCHSVMRSCLSKYSRLPSSADLILSMEPPVLQKQGGGQRQARKWAVKEWRTGLDALNYHTHGPLAAATGLQSPVTRTVP